MMLGGWDNKMKGFGDLGVGNDGGEREEVFEKIF
jgi:hypothetical protein